MHPHHPTAHEIIDLVLDPESFDSWDAPVDSSGFSERYQSQLRAAQTKTGTDESIVTGSGFIEGRRVAVVVSEFHFLGGSIGAVAAARVTDAIRRATALRLPILAFPSSGGTRMQEGTPAFVKMVTISRAVSAHKAKGLPYLVYLRHPTTGGVFASWGSQGHFTAAEPNALIGFLGPRVFESLMGKPFPSGVQQAENLVAKGIIDGVVAPADLRPLAARVLTLLSPNTAQLNPGEVSFTPITHRRVPVWEGVELTRCPDRPGIRELLKYAADDVIPLNGTGWGEPGTTIMVALASFEGLRCVVVGQDRRAARPEGPGDLRKARRAMRLSRELGLPLVSIIDTAGAELSKEAEEGGLAGEIARSLVDKTDLEVPSVSVLLGQGAGGAALALLPAERVIACEHAWLSPLPPEGASTIVYRTPDRAAELAEQQRVGSFELHHEGIVDLILAEDPPAAQDPECFARMVASACVHELRAQLAH